MWEEGSPWPHTLSTLSVRLNPMLGHMAGECERKEQQMEAPGLGSRDTKARGRDGEAGARNSPDSREPALGLQLVMQAA